MSGFYQNDMTKSIAQPSDELANDRYIERMLTATTTGAISTAVRDQFVFATNFAPKCGQVIFT